MCHSSVRNDSSVRSGSSHTPSTIVRCGIYTRARTEEGLPTECAALINQYERCSSYVSARADDMWRVTATYYDGSYGAADKHRPALQRMLADLGKGQLDVILVASFDRLWRSSRDMCDFLSQLTQADVGFVSVNQAVDTTTAAGRLTMNALWQFSASFLYDNEERSHE
ncbi:MAG: recombinase family protein [Planctomycetales bacterium]|nr:recombinase family protein [bacterium]UNM08243.1 MAG: recombinase family protein [Planctomycetales bacterium]